MGWDRENIKSECIGEIGNHYGGLHIQKVDNKFYWIIENYDTDFTDLSEWEEISENLYNSLKNELTIKTDNNE